MSAALPRVCILTSGVGSRMGEFSDLTNKSLLPLAQRAIITHIIQKFPIGTEFVISLGYMSDHVTSYLELAHPETRFHFCVVDKFEGPGTGPAYSLSCCKDFLQQPFYFVSCDTLWHEPFDLSPSVDSWFAAANVDDGECDNYCNFRHEDGAITEVFDKQSVVGRDILAFSGLCYIADVEVFWKGLDARKLVKNELQISNGILALVNARIARVREIQWIDVGDANKYKEAVQQESSDFDFSKTDELLYFVKGRVLKFFRDEKLAQRRFARALKNASVFPKMVGQKQGFYAYEKVP